MKLVLNKCYGGFGLSSLAVAEYAKLKGLKHVKSTPKYGPNSGYDLLTKDMSSPEVVTDAQWNAGDYMTDSGIERTDLALIKVVEKLGAKANGKHAQLAVIEIPDDIAYTIEEYDGIETVAEIHRTWG